MTDVIKAIGTVWHSIRAYATAHKVISTIIIIVVLVGGYYGYKTLTSTTGETSYVTTTAATSTVISTLSESGTISATSDINVQSQTSGAVLGIYVKPGTHVYAGTVIAKVDPTDALQTYNDAELSYETAELTYEKATASSTALELLQAKNAVTNAQTALDKSRDSTYASIASVYTDLSSVMSGLDSILHNSNVTSRLNQQNVDAYGDIVSTQDSSISIFKNSAVTSYTAATTAYNNALTAYKVTSRTMSNDQIIALAQNTYVAAQAVADAVKNSHDFFDRVSSDYTLYNFGTSSTLAGLLSSVNNYTAIVNNDLSGVLSDKTNIVSAEQSLAESQDALTNAQQGPDDLVIKSAALTLKKAQETLATAKKALADCYISAPFSGTVSSIAVDQYQTVGNGTAIATMVSDNELATLSVSEADAINIKTGQKATITFDALPDVTIAGTVDSISAAGSVSSGVVSYTVNVSLDTKNDQVRPGMSVTADIITGTATGLAVPSSAVKTSGSSSYVLVFNPPLETTSSTIGTVTRQVPTKVTVVTGLAGDTETIITKGLSDGEQVVTKMSVVSSSSTSSSPSSSSSRSSASSLRGITGGPGGL